MAFLTVPPASDVSPCRRVSARQPSDGSRGGQCVTCDGPPGCRYVRAIFSADASHYMLDCLGPDVPSCVLRQTLDDTGGYAGAEDAGN